MILIHLAGGLGNQMFQYAFARAFSLRHGVVMKLDASEYPQRDLRTYELGNFKIEGNLATPGDIRRIRNPYGIISKGIRFLKRKVLRKSYLDYHPELLTYADNVYFHGFLQCEKHFLDARDALRRDFTLAKEPGPEAKQIAEKIRETAWPVSLHVRRTDYVEDPKKRTCFGGCSLDYYRRATEIISSRYPEASFFIFSDDIAWVKDNLEIPHSFTHVSSPGIKDHEEIHLMSLCRHHIIANSSFSWWGAWLNNQADKMVIAPQKWTNLVPEVHPNIVSESWIKIPN